MTPTVIAVPARRVVLLAALAALAPAPARAEATAPAMPKPQDYSYVYDVFDNSVARPIARTLDVPRLIRRASGRPREAADVDANDQVRLPSTWWQPRVGYRAVTPEQVALGASDPPAPGRWTVVHAKDEGVTPGFQVKDARGVKYYLKFDTIGYPELATGAEMIGARLLWAAGYNTPSYDVAWFRPEDLDIAPGVKYKDARGREHPLTRAYVDALLAQVAREPDGRYRCSASRQLEGKPLGPFRWEGRRRDDPDDLVPHELRRELRGLWVLCAWTNHADSRSANTLDTWVSEGGRSFVRHHLIDFSAVLGAGRDGPRAYPTGSEYYADYGVMARQLATLGLASFKWEAAVDPHMPSVGFVEARTFDPVSWRPDYPNPAFDDRTTRDVRWGARIVAGFDDDMIRAAVASARYSDPRASDYITRVLIARRDILVRHWLGPQAGPRTPAAPPMRAAR